MKTVTICGSMKFEKEMMKIAFMLETKYHLNVLQCVYNTECQEISENEMNWLQQSHYKKIEMSEAIYIVDLKGYIGKQVAKEIEYAKRLGKEVIYHSKFMAGNTNPRLV